MSIRTIWVKVKCDENLLDEVHDEVRSLLERIDGVVSVDLTVDDEDDEEEEDPDEY